MVLPGKNIGSACFLYMGETKMGVGVRCMLGLVSNNLKIIYSHGPKRPTRKKAFFLMEAFFLVGIFGVTPYIHMLNIDSDGGGCRNLLVRVVRSITYSDLPTDNISLA